MRRRCSTLDSARAALLGPGVRAAGCLWGLGVSPGATSETGGSVPLGARDLVSWVSGEAVLMVTVGGSVCPHGRTLCLFMCMGGCMRVQVPVHVTVTV